MIKMSNKRKYEELYETEDETEDETELNSQIYYDVYWSDPENLDELCDYPDENDFYSI